MAEGGFSKCPSILAIEIFEIEREFSYGCGQGVCEYQADPFDKQKHDNRESEQYHHDFQQMI